MTTFAAADRVATESVRVLHVDDEPDFADTAGALIERHDDRITVEPVTDAETGLSVLDRHDVDCVVSDYDMPDTNGIEFLHAVRERDPKLPFILYTGKGSEEVASEAISAGVTDYLQKESGTSQYAVLANRIANAVERYRSRHAADETERKLSEIAEKTDDVLFTFDGDWDELLFVNSAYEEIYGGSIAELARNPQSFLEIVHPEDRERVVETMERLSGGEPAEVEYRIVRPDGETRWVQSDSKPVFDDGTVSRIVGYTQDVTARTERERELERLKRRYQAFVEHASDVITIIDETGEIQYESPAIEQLGYEQEELVGENSFEYIHPDDREEAVETFSEVLTRPESMERVEFRFERADGSYVWLEASGNSETDEAVGGYVITSRDVTERKERERELRRRNDRLDEFASVVSHDLRNPLSVAGGWLELAREECDSDHLENVADAHDRMNDLIDDLLELAREGDEVSAREPIDLATFTETCWRNVDTDDATLRVAVDRRVEADRSRLQQLLENLYRNAIDHGGRDVTVTVGDLDDGFSVEDDGPGIPEDVRENVFDAGYSTTQSGTGFGLSIVYDVAESHGWTVDVTAGDEGGARIEITGLSSA